MIQEGTKTEDEHQKLSEPIPEQEIVIQSIRETIVPKLVAEDIPLLTRYCYEFLLVVIIFVIHGD